jgi:hypothetical protein
VSFWSCDIGFLWFHVTEGNFVLFWLYLYVEGMSRLSYELWMKRMSGV